MPAHRLAFLFLSTLLWPAASLARVFNVTIDDTLGDERTGERPRYTPPDWRPRSVAGTPCPDCIANPDPTLVIGGTWHDNSTFTGQDPSTVSMNFNGTAIYVFCIIANGLPHTINTTRLAFYLDDLSTQIGSFLHELDTTQSAPYYLYNREVFKAVSLPPGNHTLLVANQPGDAGSLVLFDYALYTTEEPDSSESELPPESTSTTTAGVPGHSTAPTPAGRNAKAEIGGAAAGGVIAALALLAVGYWVYSRRKAAQGFVAEAQAHPQEGSSSKLRSTDRASSSAPAPAATHGGRESSGLRYEIGRMREELARVRRLAEPPEYSGPAVSPPLEGQASSPGRAGRMKVVMAADHVQAA